MAGLLRTRTGREARVGTVELFFDLVFVFAITQLSLGLLEQPDWLGALETALLFLGVWWIWICTCWATNWLNPESGRVRILLFTLMACGMVLSMAIPQAWGKRGLVFGAAFAIAQIGRSLFTAIALRNHGSHGRFPRITIWFTASGIFWVGGGVAHGTERMLFWTVALAIEYIGPFAYFYVPGIGRQRSDDWDVEGRHMAERCGLFIIIALGETILVTGTTAARTAWSLPVLTVLGSAFVATIAMWWIYFNNGAEPARRVIAHADHPGRLARLAYTYFHLPIVAGIIVLAAGDEMVIAYPIDYPDSPTLATHMAGPALFLIGNLLFKRTTWQRWPFSHVGGLAVLGLGGLLPLPNGLALSLWASATLVLVATWETRSLRNASGLG